MGRAQQHTEATARGQDLVGTSHPKQHPRSPPGCCQDPWEQTPHWVTPRPQTTIPPAPISSGQTLLSSIVSWCCGMLVAFLCFFSTPPHWKSGAKAGGSPRHSSCTAGRGGERSSPAERERRAAASGYGKTSQEPPEPSVPRLQPLREALLGVSTARASLHSPRASPGCLVSGSSVTSQKTELLLEPPPGARTSLAATTPPGSGCSGRSTQQTLLGTGLAAGEGEAMPPHSSHLVPTPAQASARFP